MIYFAAGVVLLVALLAAGRALADAEPATVRRLSLWAGGLLALGLAWVLMETGQIIALLVLVVVGVVLAWRSEASIKRWVHGEGRGPRRSSTVKSDYLRLSLDHDTGTMTGSVRKGPYQGQRIEDLDIADLLALRHEVMKADPPSIMLLESYLDGFMPDWRKSESEPGESATNTLSMTREEALAVLGLQANAKTADILAAHVRLMMKLHPEQGGSDRLVEQVNRAKEVLLGE
jgi:hypothetical protein